MSDRLDTNERYAYYDRAADIVWIPTGFSDDVVNEQTDWGLLDYDASSDAVVGIEIWAASGRLPADLLENLPHPPKQQKA